MSLALLYLKNNKVNKILPNLYLGNKFSPNKNYDLIINCSINLPNVIDNTINIKLKDSLTEAKNMYKQLNEKNILEEIHLTLENNKKVLVHCHMGMQRSATVIACYLIKYYNFEIQKVINFLKSKRKIAFFSCVNFIETINKIYEDSKKNEIY